MTREQYLAKRQKLMNEAQALIDSGKLEDSATKMKEIENLDAEYNELAKAQANLNALQDDSKTGMKAFFDPQSSGEPTYSNKAEMYSSVEYRKAFMENVLHGTAIPSRFKNADAQTTTDEVSTVIPTVHIQKIYRKLETIGKFYNMVTKTNIKGGVEYPTAAFALEASWVAERATSETQEAKTGSVTFTWHKLICKVAISFETDVLTLEAFEADFIDQISKAMVKAIEKAIFTGSGSGCPKGFLTETVADGQNVDITEGSHITYADLLAAESKIPDEYDAGSVWVMPKATYYNEILGMVDEQGHPIARINAGIDGKPEHTILGRRVEFSPYMDAFSTTVEKDTIVAAVFDFSAFVLNTSHKITIKRYTDESTDDTVIKSLALLDGKVIDKNSLVTITVKNS